MDASVSPDLLRQELNSAHPPLVVDVRGSPAFLASPGLIAGALRRDPEQAATWAAALPAAAGVVLYCVHGREVSRGAASVLAGLGLRARFLEGGIEAWRAAGGELAEKPVGASTRWVTRERPKIDRIACPWLIRRFIDPGAEFLYVPSAEVRRIAAARAATAYDIADVRLSHEGERCSFDAFLAAYRLRDPALAELAVIVRGADTARLDLAPQAAGLAAISLGLSRLYQDDFEMLARGMIVYDALYAWCREGKGESHTWNPQAYP
ncbi:MAG: chromate resistance protein [Betaproteobacteria bacterium]|nr:chromate resistance protein [Betaproteobacteria bacterium]